MKSQTLYELTIEMIQFEKFCEDNPELDEQSKKDTLDSIKLPFDKKVIGVAYAMKNVETPVAAIDAEIKRLQAKKSAITNKVTWFKDYLKESMFAAKTDVVENDLIKVRLQNSPSSLDEIVDIDNLPEKFKRHIIEVEDFKNLPEKFIRNHISLDADKKAIIAELKAERPVVGCKLKDGINSKHIRTY